MSQNVINELQGPVAITPMYGGRVTMFTPLEKSYPIIPVVVNRDKNGVINVREANSEDIKDASPR